MKKIICFATLICFFFSHSPFLLASGANGSNEKQDNMQFMSETDQKLEIGHMLDQYMCISFVMLQNDTLVSAITDTLMSLNPLSTASDTETRIVRIINDSTPISTAFPGYIYISTGALDVIQNKEELAALLANALIREEANYYFQSFMDDWKKKERIQIATSILVLGIFVAGTVIGISAASSAASGSSSSLEGSLAAQQAAQQSINITSAITGSATVLACNAGNALIKELPERKIQFFALGPWLTSMSVAESTSVFYFFKEIYEGYGDEKESRSLEQTVTMLKSSGHNPDALFSLLRNIDKLKKDYISKGYYSRLLAYSPDAIDRIAGSYEPFNK